MTNDLSYSVQMQFMRPDQLEAATRAFPVVYVPFGLIEWHGRHLPLGNDALNAHGVLVKAAEKFGGVVYPPVYFHSGNQPDRTLPQLTAEHLVPVLSNLFECLKKTGFRVIIGASGHAVQEQVEMINKALEPVVSDGTVAGVGVWKMCPEAGGDHAAKWETSEMMFFYPDLVDMSKLGTGPLAPDMKPPDGIGGLDPRKHASAQAGRRNVELAAEAIGKKANELLQSLPKDKRTFSLEHINPEYWWSI